MGWSTVQSSDIYLRSDRGLDIVVGHSIDHVLTEIALNS